MDVCLVVWVSSVDRGNTFPPLVMLFLLQRFLVNRTVSL